jgi:hypothetical protein
MCQYFEIFFVYGYYTLLDEWALENQRLISASTQSYCKLRLLELDLDQARANRDGVVPSPNSARLEISVLL